MKLDRRSIRVLIAAVIASVAWFLNLLSSDQEANTTKRGTFAVVRAIEQRLSDQMVETEARVTRLLPDDEHGSRHQRFLVDIAGHSVLIAHNIDLAPRIPLRKNDTVRVRGEFEWNEKGGVIHWTHRDPQNRHPHGWVEHQGRKFQ